MTRKTTAEESPTTETETVETEGAAAPEAEGTTDANPAESSPADNEDAKEPASLLDVVKSAVEPKAEPEESSTAEGEEGAKPEATEEAEKAAEGSEGEAENLPFHNHPRWKELVSERDSLRDPAGKYGQIQEFMQTHGLSGEEVAEGYQIMALLKSGDPEKLAEARGWFAERLEALDGALGNVLPDDLRARVDNGYLDEEGALEIARSRAGETLRTERATREQQAAKAQQEREAQQARTGEMVNAVTSWEERVRASDPDYGRKADLVQAKCKAIVEREGNPPRTAAEATALADRALREVNETLSSMLPKPRPIRSTPRSQSAVTSREVKSVRDAIENALG